MLKHWTGSHFEDVSFQSLGIQIHLGHSGGLCSIPGKTINNFTIVHTNGFHLCKVQFCRCYSSPGGSASNIQLLRSRIFPATALHPQVGFTFEVLEFFHNLTLQSKVSAYDYYMALSKFSSKVTKHSGKVCNLLH